MDVGRVGPEQPGLAHLLDLGILTVGPHPDVGGDPRPGLPGQLPVVPGHLEVGELGAGRRQGQGEHLVLRGEVLGGGPNEPARLPLFPLAPPGEPVGEHGPEARVLERLDHRVGVGR